MRPKNVFTILSVLFILPLFSFRYEVKMKIYYNITETMVVNSSSDGESPNNNKWFVSDVYTNECYMSEDAGRSFVKYINANYFEKEGFEYLGNTVTWSSYSSRQAAQDDLNEKIVKMKESGYKVVRVKDWSYECSN